MNVSPGVTVVETEYHYVLPTVVRAFDNTNKLGRAYYITDNNVVQWVKSHPKHLWEEEPNVDFLPAYVISPELETFFLLRWT